MNLHRLDLVPLSLFALVVPQKHPLAARRRLAFAEAIELSDPWVERELLLGAPGAGAAQLQLELAKALDTPDAKEKLAAVGCEPFKSTPEQFAALIKDDLPRWAKIVKESGATVD